LGRNVLHWWIRWRAPKSFSIWHFLYVFGTCFQLIMYNMHMLFLSTKTYEITWFKSLVLRSIFPLFCINYKFWKEKGCDSDRLGNSFGFLMLNVYIVVVAVRITTRQLLSWRKKRKKKMADAHTTFLCFPFHHHLISWSYQLFKTSHKTNISFLCPNFSIATTASVPYLLHEWTYLPLNWLVW